MVSLRSAKSSTMLWYCTDDYLHSIVLTNFCFCAGLIKNQNLLGTPGAVWIADQIQRSNCLSAEWNGHSFERGLPRYKSALKHNFEMQTGELLTVNTSKVRNKQYFICDAGFGKSRKTSWLRFETLLPVAGFHDKSSDARVDERNRSISQRLVYSQGKRACFFERRQFWQGH